MSHLARTFSTSLRKESWKLTLKCINNRFEYSRFTVKNLNRESGFICSRVSQVSYFMSLSRTIIRGPRAGVWRCVYSFAHDGHHQQVVDTACQIPWFFWIGRQLTLVHVDVDYNTFNWYGRVQNQNRTGTPKTHSFPDLYSGKSRFFRFLSLHTFRIIRVVQTSTKVPSIFFGNSCYVTLRGSIYMLSNSHLYTFLCNRSWLLDDLSIAEDSDINNLRSVLAAVKEITRKNALDVLWHSILILQVWLDGRLRYPVCTPGFWGARRGDSEGHLVRASPPAIPAALSSDWNASNLKVSVTQGLRYVLPNTLLSGPTFPSFMPSR